MHLKPTANIHELVSRLKLVKDKFGTDEAQRTIEQVYSLDQVGKFIEAYLLSLEGFQESLDKTVNIIQEWAEKEEYASKDLEKRKLLEGYPIREMLINMMVSIHTHCREDDKEYELTKAIALVSKHTPFGKVDTENLPDDTDLRAYRRKIKLTSSLLTLMAMGDLVNVIPAYLAVSETVSISTAWVLSEELKNMLGQAKYLPPLIYKPKDIRKNSESVYLLRNSHRITNRLQRTDGDLALDFINTVTKTAYSLNIDLLCEIDDQFEYDPESKLSRDIQYKNWKRLKTETNETALILSGLGNKFYFEWFYDYRGRCYTAGYHINPQGNDYRKAMLDFHEPREIGGWEQYADVFDFPYEEDSEFDYSEEDLAF